MIYVGYLLFGMLALRFLVVLVNFLSRPYLPKATLEREPKVSILIPARNEEQTLPHLLSDLSKLEYSNFEVWVCDDHSTDSTPLILEQAVQNDARVHFFTKNELPKGWKGKNHACHALAQRASGDYFLFVDADVRLEPQAVTRAVAHAKTRRLGLLSVFPKQLIQTKGEWKTVPLMNWILLSFLPLALVRMKWFPSLSAANGQFMLFDAQIYRTYEWHKQVRNNTVEDIAIARLMKKKRINIAVLLGQNDVACRMYSGFDEAIQGFSRNVHQYFGGSRLWLVAFWLLVWARWPFFALSGQWVLLAIAIVFSFIMKVLISSLSQQALHFNLKFHFSQLGAFTQIVLKNLQAARRGRVEWKGRIYSE